MKYEGAAHVRRLEELIGRLKAGGKVSKRDMRAVLNAGDMAAHEANWQSIKAYDEERRTTPGALKRYVELLRSADALEQQANRSTRNAVKLREKAQAAYERALEHLGEVLEADRSLIQWLDREFDYGAGGRIAPDAESVPRLRAGRSRHKDRDSAGRTTLKDAKLRTLEEKLASLQKQKGPAREQVAQDLQARLKRLKR